MLDKSIFHPRLSIYKKPFGAVPTGTAVHFSTGLPEHAVGCVLSLSSEFYGTVDQIPMAADSNGFHCTYTAPEAVDLIWYTFLFSFPDGSTRPYGADGFAPDSGAVPPFQLTVYDGAPRHPHGSVTVSPIRFFLIASAAWKSLTLQE